RRVVILGGILSSLGMLLASFSTGLYQLYLSIGVVSGLGWALIFSPSMAAVTSHFSRRRTLATGFVLTGCGVFSFALTPLLQFLVETFSWRGAMLLLSAVTLHSVPCGALLRPLSSGPPQPQRSFLWGWELLRDWSFMRYCLAITLINAAYFVPYLHLVAHMRLRGVGERLAAVLMSLVGVADVAGRLFAGWLADLTPKRVLLHLSFWTGLTALVLGLLPLAGNEVGMGVAAVAYGFSAGALTPGVFSCLPLVVGTEKVLPALGLLQMVESGDDVTTPRISPPGWLRDWTGDFSISFIICGVFLILGAIIILTLPGALCRRSQSESRIPQSANGPAAKERLIVTNGTSWAGHPSLVEYRGGANLPPYVMSSSELREPCLSTAGTGPAPCAVTSSHTANTELPCHQ
ncbi:PREDICTED: monocarboxylate transporter 13-like, partial [Nanorana parkeri]|uniref:monocarboxylate transporter 13-like n=1 Tax=Nanorana parkeri TaxID=125878 RepID=UPI0008547A89